MTFSNVRKSHINWVLAGAVLLAGACTTGEDAGSDAITEATTESTSAALDEVLGQSEQAEVASFVKDLHNCGPKFKIQPILNCVDKIKDGQYVAHFGYNNKTTSTITINVGLLNRFFPSPANRGQPTKFSKGTNNDVFKVPFNGSLIVWGVDGNIALAHRTSKLCPVVPPPVCKTDCDDKNPCTADICDASTKFVCTHKNLSSGTSCADANACNGTETCDGKGKCVAGTTLKCDDKNVCTSDKCDAKLGCVFTNLADGSSCPVSGNCGAGGQCKAGVCKALGANCDDKNPCTTDSCSGGTTCKHVLVAAGTSCSDNDSCNGSETCDAMGVCKAGPAPDCDDKNPCTIDSCATAGGCGHVPGNDGVACVVSPGVPGICSAGACKGDIVICPPSTDPCKVNKNVNGVCVLQNAADDIACDDGDKCTQKDACKSGVCTGSNPVACSGGSACTNAGTCDKATGLCVGGTPVAQGTPCSDNSLCTTGDVCNGSGQCVGTAKVCAASDQCHTAGVCDASTGNCTNPNATNGTTCNDGVKCTGSDVCTNGVCGGTAVTCAPASACHPQGVCDETSGQCTTPVAPVDSPCDDGNKCTVSDKCSATGVCIPGTAVSCSGAGACTDAGTCNPTTGLCSGGTPKQDGTSCDDGVKCTSGDKCTGGTCAGVATVCAAPTDACHVRAVCSEATGTCPASPAAPIDTPCNDSNACTTVDKCDANGVCQGGTPVQCTGATACMQAGSCDTSTGLCVGGVPKPDTTTCDDGKGCTTLDHCSNGTCGGTPTVCGAPSDACHLQGVCQEPSGTCSNPVAPAGTSCSDGLNCTSPDKCDANGVCAGTPVVCPAPADACHLQGVCQEQGGCTAPAAPAGTSCSDGLACTSGDSCNGNGSCTPGAPKCPANQTCSEPTGTCGGGSTTLVDSPACVACIQGFIDSGDCDPPAAGCDSIKTGAADIALCKSLYTCLITKADTKTLPVGNPPGLCWAPPHIPLDCLCGSAGEGQDCFSAKADGVCKDEIRAAALVTDPAVFDAPATRLFSDKFPVGFAANRAFCAHEFCVNECTHPVVGP